MIVNNSFMQWLKSLPDELTLDNPTAILVNSLYVANTVETPSDYLLVNNIPVNSICLDNITYIDNKMTINDKNIIEDTTTEIIPMTDLEIVSDSSTVTLKGQDIGFTITPPKAINPDDKVFCRVYIETTDNKIKFIDQSRGV
jgi:hypothetical protein